MVFLHFPTNFTDEELVLQAKYAKLRKKKKALQEFTKPKAEPEKLNPLKRTLDPKEAKELAKKLVLSGKISVGLNKGQEKTIFRRPNGLERKLTEAKVPTAVAMIVSSTYNQPSSALLTSIPPPPQQQPLSTATTPSSNTGSSSASGTGSSSATTATTTSTSTATTSAEVLPYTPFTSSTFNNKRFDKPKQTAIVAPIRKVDPGAPSGAATATAGGAGASASTSGEGSGSGASGNEPVPGPSSAMYNRGGGGGGGAWGGGGTRGGRGLGYNRYEAHSGPKPGHTVHVKATGGRRKLTEESCREIFSQIGTIVNITMELERNCGFVTFDKVELAERAIAELDKSYQREILLAVSFARRQPPLSDLLNDPSPSLFWTHLASNQSQKSSHHDKRSQIVYNDGDDLF